MEAYTIRVEEPTAEDGKRPSAGSVYRSIYARNGPIDLPPGIESPWCLFRLSAESFPKKQMLGRRQVIDDKATPYVWQTYQQVFGEAVKVGFAIRRSGLNPGDRAGIYGSNSPEWIIAMEACNSQGICYVPLYDTLGVHATEFIINHAELNIVFVQESKIPSTLIHLPRCSTFLRTIVSFGMVTGDQKKEAEQFGVNCFSWKDFMALGLSSSELPTKSKDEICTIMYTSGTTGEPKGVVLTNKAILAGVLDADYLLQKTDRVVNEEDFYLSYLPLAHVFDQIMEIYCIFKGASIGFWQGDPRRVMEDIQELKPTIFCGVPRIYDRIYAGINQKIQSGGLISRLLFEYAYQHKLNNLKRGMRQEEASVFFDKLVFNKIKQGLGGRVRLMISGAAPIPKQVEEFLRVTSCCVFVQGYGLTECCGACFTAIANVFPMVGTVGVPIPTLEARLESVPEMNYDPLSSSAPRGEICLRGPTVFCGYHKRQDLTNEALVDGWLHTGDIGEWQPNGAMKIIDRKKNIFKLSQGEYVALESIESAYNQCPLVTSIWVYGSSFEPFLVAVAVPERKPLEDWAATNQIKIGSFEELCKHQKARSYILDELNATGRKLQLRGFEMLKAVHLEPRLFDVERDQVTPTFKLKRPQLLHYYKDEIDKLYQEAKQAKA